MLEINWVDVINVIHSITPHLIVIAVALVLGIVVMVVVRKQPKIKTSCTGFSIERWRYGWFCFKEH